MAAHSLSKIISKLPDLLHNLIGFINIFNDLCRNLFDAFSSNKRRFILKLQDSHRMSGNH